MNKLQRWIVGKKTADLLDQLKAAPQGGRYEYVGGTIVWMPDNFDSYVKNGYQLNDIIYSAVMLVMDKVRMAPWGIYKVEDEGSLKQYNAIISGRFGPGDFVKALKLRRKALIPVENPDRRSSKVKELLEWANEDTSWNDHVADGAGYKMITGNKYQWADILSAGANEGLPQQIKNMPAQHMVIKGKTSWPQRALGYQLSCGEYKDFTREEVLHEKFWNPTYNVNGAGLYGQSPLQAARRRVTRSNNSQKAGAVQLENNGSPGIAFVDNDKISATEGKAQAEAVKKVWANEYTGPENYGKVAFAGTKFGYVSVGSTLKDMALTEIEEIDLRMLANIWGIPSVLLNDPGNKSWNNLTESEKALTSRCAMSHLVSSRNNYNRKFKTDWGLKGSKMVIDFDPSVYTELQENLKEKWEWLREVPIKLKDKIDAMGFEIPDDPMMEEIAMTGNWVLLKDIVQGMDDQQFDQEDDALNKAGLNDYLRAVK